MELSLRDALTVIHGMVFGGLLLLGYSGALVAIFAMSAAGNPWRPEARGERTFSIYLTAMACLAWLAVLAGAYGIYPWYRAVPAAGADLAGFPQRLLMSSASTSEWHDIGMEWKEHIAWLAPISLTACAWIFRRYGGRLRVMKGLRNLMIGLVATAFAATCVAGFFGAMLNKFAPVRGGGEIILMKGEAGG